MRTLDEQREEYSHQRFLAMPLTGAAVWLVVAVASLFLTPVQTVWILFIGTGSIVYIAMFVSKFTGEDFLDKSKSKNTFDTLFFIQRFPHWQYLQLPHPFSWWTIHLYR